MLKPLKVLVSGSGIAGSVFTSCLLRAYPKANITIVERAPSPRLTGASVDIRSSAVDIFKWMGHEEDIRKNATQEQGIQYVDAKGKTIATLMATGRSDIQSITSEYEIFRGALAKIFFAPIQDQVELIFNETVRFYDQKDDGVKVTFASGKTETYDMLVVADGLGSRLRGQMLGTDPREQIHDEGVHAAYFTIKKDLLQGSRLAKWYNMTGGRNVFLRPDPHPEGRVRGNLLNVTWKSDTAMRGRLNKALQEGSESYLQLMEELFEDGDWLTPEVLQGMRESDDFYCSSFTQVRAPKLHDGRVVLLGDAGYAVPGFGTSLAIIGGYVLAGELLSHSCDVKAAVTRYEELLLPYARGMQGDDVAMQLLNPQTWWGLVVRNAVLRVITTLRLPQIAVWGASKLGISESWFPLPDYPWPAAQSRQDGGKEENNIDPLMLGRASQCM